MELRINDENLFWYLDQLGYRKVKSGRWIEELVDDGQGFPRTIYTCPFCNQTTDYDTNYCPECGARLKEYE